MGSRFNTYPEYPPRVRVEWLIATTRVMLAAGALLAVAISPFAPGGQRLVTYSFALYLAYSIVVLALVWRPVRFARGWDLALHLFDLAAFSLFTLLTEGVTSPFFVYFIFLVICGTLRWGLRGAIWTALAAITLYGTVTLYSVTVLRQADYEVSVFIIRSVHLIVVAALLGYLGAYQHRFQREINRVVSWPRKVPRDLRQLGAEILEQCAAILESSKVLLVWEDPEDGDVNLGWRFDGALSWASEPEGTYGSFVISWLEHKSFQAGNVADERGRVVYWSDHAFRQRYGRPINAALHERFGMRAVQSWSLDGELVRGRLLVLDKPRMRLDDLIFGELVGRLAVARLDTLYLLRRVGQSAALEERLRVARDLHDSLLQTIAGTALQLLVARRLLDTRPEAARERLLDAQTQLEQGELEMRSYIRGLRPATGVASAPRVGFNERLLELSRRIDRQWEVKVRMRLHADADDWPESLTDTLYRIVQEGVLNAVRHADASVIAVDVSLEGNRLRLRIADDGRGFPFHGTFDLQTLNELNQGPLTLKERVSELGADLTLQTGDTGTELLIVVPFAPVTS